MFVDFSACTIGPIGGSGACQVQNYRLAYRRIFGKDIPLQEQPHGALKMMQSAVQSLAELVTSGYFDMRFFDAYLT